MRRCVRCVMDDTDVAIRIGRDGVCDHCVTFETSTLPHWEGARARPDVLEALVSRVREEGRQRDFDCVVGVGGGIDSSYLTYVAKEVLGLRPLVFHVDAGWNSDLAVSNIAAVVDGLGLDLFTEVIDWDEMRDLQLAFFKSGVPHVDTPQDHAFFATMYKYAAKYGVKTILTGANLSTECVRNPLEWMYYQSDSRQLLDIHRRFGRRPLKKFPVTSILWHKVYLPYIKGIRVERPLNYVDYKKQDAMQLLQDRFGWRPYPQKHFESRFTKFYESYWLPSRFGYDVRKVQFSSLMLTGQMTRAEAMKSLEHPPWTEDEARREMEFVAHKLQISVDELESYRKLPKKTFRDYKSQYQLYLAGAWAMKRLGLEVGGKR